MRSLRMLILPLQHLSTPTITPSTSRVEHIAVEEKKSVGVDELKDVRERKNEDEDVRILN